MSPDTLQSVGVLAIGLGFVLIGLGGFSTFCASQQMQHSTELRDAEKRGEMTAQLTALRLENEHLQQRQIAEAAAAPPQATASAPQPYAYRPPSPPPPTVMTPESTAAIPAQAQAPAPPEPIGEGPPAELPRAVAREPASWEEPASLEPELPGRYLSVHQQRVIAETLRAHGRHEIAVESSYRDKVAREFAEELCAAFNQADWRARGVDEHRGLPLPSGVTVSAASFPPRPETRAVYEALLSAGIAVTQQLDPRQHGSETIVLVGTPM